MILNEIMQADNCQSAGGICNPPSSAVPVAGASDEAFDSYENINLPVAGYGLMRIRVDSDLVDEILAHRWSIGCDNRPVVYDERSHQSVPLHRWLPGIGNDRSRCVLFLNRNNRDYRLANLVSISKSLLCRGYDPRNPDCEWPGSSMRNIRITNSGKFNVVIAYRMRRIHAPVCNNVSEAQSIKRYILCRIEPDLQVLWGHFQLPVELAERFQERIDQKILRIETMENPPVTPLPNIYRSHSVIGMSYRYRFHYYGRLFEDDGFRTLEAAVLAYNNRVMEVTGDPSRQHLLS